MYVAASEVASNHKQHMVGMDYESMLLMSKKRLYAIGFGDNGIGRLPIIVSFPDSYRKFEPKSFLASLPQKSMVAWDKNFDANMKNLY